MDDFFGDNLSKRPKRKRRLATDKVYFVPPDRFDLTHERQLYVIAQQT
jgi:hypothetical protein